MHLCRRDYPQHSLGDAAGPVLVATTTDTKGSWRQTERLLQAGGRMLPSVVRPPRSQSPRQTAPQGAPPNSRFLHVQPVPHGQGALPATLGHWLSPDAGSKSACLSLTIFLPRLDPHPHGPSQLLLILQNPGDLCTSSLLSTVSSSIKQLSRALTAQTAVICLRVSLLRGSRAAVLSLLKAATL